MSEQTGEAIVQGLLGGVESEQAAREISQNLLHIVEKSCRPLPVKEAMLAKLRSIATNGEDDVDALPEEERVAALMHATLSAVKKAKELGVDLSLVKGTSPGVGRITQEDVVNFHRFGHEPPFYIVDWNYNEKEHQVQRRDAQHWLQYSVHYPTEADAQAVADKKNEPPPESLTLPVEGSDYPIEARVPINDTIRIYLRKLRDIEVRLHKIGSSELITNGCISLVLYYASSATNYRTMLDDRIINWVKSLAVKINERIIEDRQEWLQEIQSFRNPYYIKRS